MENPKQAFRFKSHVGRFEKGHINPQNVFRWIMALWPYVEGLKEHKKAQGILAGHMMGHDAHDKISTRGLRLEVACAL